MENIINELEVIQKEVIKSNQNSMVVPVLMSKEDNEINKIMDIILSSKKIEEIKVSEDIAWLLIGFGFYMATYSLRSGDQRYFNNGLTAIIIASQTIDLKDCLRLLPLYWDVFKQKDLSFQPIIVLNTNFSKKIKLFLEREELDKTLECMGCITAI